MKHSLQYVDKLFQVRNRHNSQDNHLVISLIPRWYTYARVRVLVRVWEQPHDQLSGVIKASLSAELHSAQPSPLNPQPSPPNPHSLTPTPQSPPPTL